MRQAVADAGGAGGAVGGVGWIEAIRDACTDLAAKAIVGELAVEPLRLDGEPDPRYVAVQMSRLQLYAVNQRIAEVKSKVQRINPVTSQDEHLQLFGELVSLEQQARALRERASGGL
jgi:DNA primase